MKKKQKYFHFIVNCILLDIHEFRYYPVSEHASRLLSNWKKVWWDLDTYVFLYKAELLHVQLRAERWKQQKME